MADRVVREPERVHITGVSRTAWWEGEKAGRYPKRRRLGPGSIGWLESELIAFLRSLEPGGPAVSAAALAARLPPEGR